MFDLCFLKTDYFLSFPIGYLQLASIFVLAWDSNTHFTEKLVFQVPVSDLCVSFQVGSNVSDTTDLKGRFSNSNNAK